MQILVLGSAAGGGFPQWNCNCRNCAGLRSGAVRARPRTQSSLAVSSNQVDWAIINASPDLPAQLRQSMMLQPHRRVRDSGIRGVILVDSQLDHTLGLAGLREGDRLPIYSTSAVRQDLIEANPLLRILESYCGIEWHEITLREGARFEVAAVEGIEFAPLPVASKAPPYSSHRNSPQAGDNIALSIHDRSSSHTVFYAPGLGAVDDAVWDRMREADLVLIDGSFWSDDEMIAQGLGRKRAHEMGHLALIGESGMLSFLRKLPDRTRRILIHINNSNPILDEESLERRLLEDAGIEVAYDGMQITL